MNFKKQITAAAAIAAFLMTTLSGCSGTGENDASNASSAVTEAPSTVSAENGGTSESAGSAEKDQASANASASESSEAASSSETGKGENTDTTDAADTRENNGTDGKAADAARTQSPTYSYYLKSTPQYDSAVSDKDNTLLATSTYYLLSLADDRDPDTGENGAANDSGVQKALDVINADSVSESASFAADNQQEAQEWHDSMASNGTDAAGHYEDQNLLSAERADSRCLSVLRTHYQYYGGAHGITVTEGYSFDPETGKKLALTDVLSRTEDLASILYQEVVRQSGPDQAAGLDQDAEKTIQSMIDRDLSDDSSQDQPDNAADVGDALTWYVGGDGIHFIFDAYDIGPYAAGAYGAVLTPEDYPDLIRSPYTESPADYVTTVSLYSETDVDGTSLQITPEYDDNNDIDKLTITYGDKNVSFDDHALSLDCYLVHTQEGIYLYLDDHEENDWESLSIIDLGEDTLTKRDCDAGLYDAVLTDPDHMILSTRTQLMSTLQISRAYQAGAHGVPESSSRFWLYTGAPDQAITLKKDVTLDVLDSLHFDTTHKASFTKGTKFTLYRTDNESIVDARSEDGQYVRFTVDASSWPQKINGEYRLEALFDGTFFAG